VKFIFNNKTLRLLQVVVVAILLTGCLSPNSKSSSGSEVNSDSLFFSFSKEQQSDLEGYFDKFVKYYGFNGVFLVGQRDSVFYAGSNGYANYKNRDSLNLNSAFQLASVSKQFTAVAVLKLYQEGKLLLTDSIQKHIEGFPYKNITIHQLLIHRSGVPNYHYFFQHIPTTADTLLTNQMVLNEIQLKQPGIYYQPNRKFQYSNSGYAILASIVENVSGMSFSDYLRDEIFEPLGMEDSFAYRADANELYPEHVTGYLRRWRLSEDNYLDGVLGDKGVYSSAHDLFIWDQSLYKGTIVHPDTINLAFMPMGRPQEARVNYGYGWRMYYYGNDSIKVNFHFGWWHGFRSLIMRIPHDSTTVIALKNQSSGKMMNTRSIMKILYPAADTVAVDSLPIEIE
jgi:CubicO group peptidase (beta-lactamase class C family)